MPGLRDLRLPARPARLWPTGQPGQEIPSAPTRIRRSRSPSRQRRRSSTTSGESPSGSPAASSRRDSRTQARVSGEDPPRIRCCSAERRLACNAGFAESSEQPLPERPPSTRVLVDPLPVPTKVRDGHEQEDVIGFGLPHQLSELVSPHLGVGVGSARSARGPSPGRSPAVAMRPAPHPGERAAQRAGRRCEDRRDRARSDGRSPPRWRHGASPRRHSSKVFFVRSSPSHRLIAPGPAP